jgi:hypothetical protein
MSDVANGNTPLPVVVVVDAASRVETRPFRLVMSVVLVPTEVMMLFNCVVCVACVVLMLEMSVVFVFNCVTVDACVASRAVVLGNILLVNVPSDEILFLFVVLSVSNDETRNVRAVTDDVVAFPLSTADSLVLCDASDVSSAVVRVVRLETLLFVELRPVSNTVSLCCWELSVVSKDETRAAIAVDVVEALFDNDVTLSERVLNCVPEGTAKVSP